MTEDEAKKKWCPQIRMDEEGNCNRSPDHNHSYCIGSECMAWRTADRPPRETLRLRKGQTHKDGTPIIRAGTLVIVDGESWRYEYTDTDAEGEFDMLHRAPPETKQPHGYCGLAGVPQ